MCRWGVASSRCITALNTYVKRDYDAFVRRYKKILVEAGIEKYHPAEFYDFMQAKQERMDDMDKLKKRLIRNGLPTKELEDLSAKYKAEMKALAEELVERFSEKNNGG